MISPCSLSNFSVAETHLRLWVLCISGHGSAGLTISLPVRSDVVLNPEFSRDRSERTAVFGDCDPSKRAEQLVFSWRRHLWWIPVKDSTGAGTGRVRLDSQAFSLLSGFFWQYICHFKLCYNLLYMQHIILACVCLSWVDHRGVFLIFILKKHFGRNTFFFFVTVYYLWQAQGRQIVFQIAWFYYCSTLWYNILIL